MDSTCLITFFSLKLQVFLESPAVTHENTGMHSVLKSRQKLQILAHPVWCFCRKQFLTSHMLPCRSSFKGETHSEPLYPRCASHLVVELPPSNIHIWSTGMGQLVFGSQMKSIFAYICI